MSVIDLYTLLLKTLTNNICNHAFLFSPHPFILIFHDLKAVLSERQTMDIVVYNMSCSRHLDSEVDGAYNFDVEWLMT